MTWPRSEIINHRIETTAQTWLRSEINNHGIEKSEHNMAALKMINQGIETRGCARTMVALCKIYWEGGT